MANKTNKVVVRCTDEMKKGLEYVALKKSTTVSALVCQYVSDMLILDKKKLEMVERMDVLEVARQLGMDDILAAK